MSSWRKIEAGEGKKVSRGQPCQSRDKAFSRSCMLQRGSIRWDFLIVDMAGQHIDDMEHRIRHNRGEMCSSGKEQSFLLVD